MPGGTRWARPASAAGTAAFVPDRSRSELSPAHAPDARSTPSLDDPLRPILALSAEEKIALFS